jgi:hypothetical protein
MNIYKIISKNIKNYKEYNIADIEKFYNNSLTFSEYNKIKNRTKEEKVEIYLNYQKELAYILKYLKKKLENIDDSKLLKKNILSIHIKAIKDSKDIDINNTKQVEEYGFNFGWLDPDNYIKEKFFDCGINLINKFKKIDIRSNYCKEDICKFAQYYEWRKLIWMKSYLLIKDIDINYVEKKAKNKY